MLSFPRLVLFESQPNTRRPQPESHFRFLSLSMYTQLKKLMYGGIGPKCYSRRESTSRSECIDPNLSPLAPLWERAREGGKTL